MVVQAYKYKIITIVIIIILKFKKNTKRQNLRSTIVAESHLSKQTLISLLTNCGGKGASEILGVVKEPG